MDKLEKMDDRMLMMEQRINERMDKMGQSMDERMDKMDDRMHKMEQRMEERMAKMEKQMTDMDHRVSNQETLLTSAVNRARQVEAVAAERRIEHVRALKDIHEQDVDLEMVSGLTRIFTANGLIKPFPPHYHSDGSPPPYYQP